MANKIIVLFVEGQSEEVFYSKLCRQLQENKGTSDKIVIRDLKGIGNYEFKAYAILKNEILPKFKDVDIFVFCCYDTDVFDIPFQAKPPISWKNIEKRIKSLGFHKVYHIKAVKSIEDWFLIDSKSLLQFLKLKGPQKVKGNSGFERICFLFKKSNKVYQKGYNVSNFVDKFDYELLVEELKNELKELKSTL